MLVEHLAKTRTHAIPAKTINIFKSPWKIKVLINEKRTPINRKLK